MKTKLLLIFVFIFSFNTPANADDCTMSNDCSDAKYEYYLGENCATYYPQHWPSPKTNDICLYECNTCDAGCVKTTVKCDTSTSTCGDQYYIIIGSFASECGEYISIESCIPSGNCPANYYKTHLALNPCGCAACPEHSTSPANTADKSGCKCNVGYYGDTGALNPECKKCPDNATTNQSGSMTIGECLCKAGYYGTLTDENSICMKCPANSTSTAGSKTIDDCKCNKGYYKNGASCERCPSIGNVYGTTETSGATSINQCYMPLNTDIEDETGTFDFTSDCYYRRHYFLLH